MDIAKSILVATDFSELSGRALATALELAEALDSQVHLVHVFSLQGQPETAEMSRDELEDAELKARRKLQNVADAFRDRKRLGEVVVRHGDPAAVIVRTASELGADLILMGTHGRRGLPRLLLGSTAENVLHDADCPVWVVKSPHHRAPAAAR